MTRSVPPLVRQGATTIIDEISQLKSAASAGEDVGERLQALADHYQVFQMACSGDVEGLRRRALRGALPRVVGPLGETLLGAACAGAQEEAALFLIGHCDASAARFDGSTPLMLAALHGLSRAVKALLPLGDPRAVDERSSQDALMHAAIGGKRACVALLAGPCGLDARDARGRSALEIAARAGRTDAAALLGQLYPVEELARVCSLDLGAEGSACAPSLAALLLARQEREALDAGAQSAPGAASRAL